MSLVLSLGNADLALRRTSITLSSPRCKAELRRPPRDGECRREGVAQPDHRVR
jgi:hypothetical protein